MGEVHSYRYVNTDGVPATYSNTSFNATSWTCKVGDIIVVHCWGSPSWGSESVSGASTLASYKSTWNVSGDRYHRTYVLKATSTTVRFSAGSGGGASGMIINF